MFNFFERGMRCGVCMISKRFAHANNKDMKPLDLSKPEEASMQYNPAKPSTYIMYLDAYNLYGWAMSQPLPIGEFEWLTEAEAATFTPEEILNKSDNERYGFVFEIDLDYPAALHDAQTALPLLRTEPVHP